jgi:hypothetical protein
VQFLEIYMRYLVRIAVAITIVALLSVAVIALVLVIAAASISRVAGCMLSWSRAASAALAATSLGRRLRAPVPQAQSPTPALRASRRSNLSH